MAKTSFLFVADGPRFEPPGIILAGALRRTQGPDVAIHAYCPEAKIETLSLFFHQAMALFDVTISPIAERPSPFAAPYPHGNKILACAEMRPGSGRAVFLDTDTIALGPIAADLPDDRAAAVPEGVPTWGRAEEDWVPLYAHFGLPMPVERVNMCRGRRVETLPYFNAGFLAFPESGPEGVRFGEIWLETAAEIDHAVEIPNKRPWLDQIALPIALARARMPWQVMPEAFNFSLNRRKFPLEAPPRLAHYHLAGSFRQEIHCLEGYREVLRAMPRVMREEMRALAAPFEGPVQEHKREGFVPLVDFDALD